MKPSLLLILLCCAAVAGEGWAQPIGQNTTLLGHLAPHSPTRYSDIWGYAAGGHEYAIMGTFNGTSIIDVTNPTAPAEVAFVSGAASQWRDIKTYSHYAYVVHDANADNYPQPGLQIIDLAGLPDSVSLVRTYNTNMGPGLSHNLYIDAGYAYLAGTRTVRGALILDIADPASPLEIGSWSQNYWHDVVVKNDTMYGAAGSLRFIEIVDARDKSNPTLIAQIHYPGAYSHNAWISADNKYLSVTDENWGQPVYFYDVSNPLQASLLATYRAAPNAIAHNTHILGDLAIISYYYDGVKIIDLAQRGAPTEIGYYDTYPEDQFKRGRGYEGAWGAYPFLPSGNILVSDITHGLSVVRFDGARAGYLAGTIRDDQSQQPVSDVSITLLDAEQNFGATTHPVGDDGSYIFGALPGNRRFKFSKFGYEDVIADNVRIESGVTIKRDITLIKKPQATLEISLIGHDATPRPIVGGMIHLFAQDFETVIRTDSTGTGRVSLPAGAYQARISAWGYQRKEEVLSFSNAGLVHFEVQLEPGYLETFTDAAPWRYRDGGDDSIYDWFLVKAADTPFGGRLLSFDHTGDPDGYVAVSRARYGRSTLTSPPFDALRFERPVVQFAHYYNPYRWATVQANDTLLVQVSNDTGLHWVTLDAFTAIDAQWTTATYLLSDYISPSASMLLRFVNIEGPEDTGADRGSAFGMLDDIVIQSSGVLTDSAGNPLIPEQLALGPNYPNPFNPATTVTWQQPHAGTARILVMNLLGQRVAEFTAGPAKAGRQELHINLEGLPTGVYFYRVQVGEQLSGVRKMLFLK